MIKNNVVRITALSAMIMGIQVCASSYASSLSFRAQEPQNFTAQELMKQESSLKGKTVTFKGDNYKVTEDELHAYDKDNGNVLSRWVTLKKHKTCFLRTQEINLVAQGITRGGADVYVGPDNSQVRRWDWSMHGSDVCPRSRTYYSPLAKVGMGVVAALGIGAWVYSKNKSARSKQG